MRKKFILSITALFLVLALFLSIKANSSETRVNWWRFQSIDTMKYSRDVSREKLNDPSFDIIINEQIENIASTGATHVAIATPYDEEFYPILVRWVNAARRHGLNVWFRGNWSGWENWFEYSDITREQHITKTDSFIRTHSDLFEDGDVFTACPECENGGPGDPRQNGDVKGHRKFLIDEYEVTKVAFKTINKDVTSNFNSMNGDVARLVMDKETTKALDGIVTIDHYVSTPEKLAKDIKDLSRQSGGEIILGEFGAPIPDIHGQMTEEQQAQWLDSALGMLINTPELVGLSYWTNTGSSTELWNGKGEPRLAADVVRKYYDTDVVKIKVNDEAGSQIKDASVSIGDRKFNPDQDGSYFVPYSKNASSVSINAQGFYPLSVTLKDLNEMNLALKKTDEGIIFKLRKLLNSIF